MSRHLRAVLSSILSPEDLERIYNAYDIIGDIAIIRLKETSRNLGRVVAEAIMTAHENVKTVLAQIGPVCGDFRLRELEHVAGEHRTVTVHKEAGSLLKVNVRDCYFSPRLFHERARIAGLVRSGEVIVNMFAGVGSFSIIAAKQSDRGKVYSVDVNPAAVDYMKENIRINGVYGRVIPVLGDAKEVIQERLRKVADRVLMPLPEMALKCLPCALVTLKDDGGWIHYYDFEHAMKSEDPVDKVRLKVAERLAESRVAFEIPFGRIVRTTGPNWYQIVLDIHVKRIGEAPLNAK